MKQLKINVDLSERGIRRMPIKDGKYLFDGVDIKGDFNISYNQLKTLEGCPVKVDNLYLYGNYGLTSLEYIPFSRGILNLSFLYELTSLQGFTQREVFSHFELAGSPLESLEGVPEIIHGNFSVANCNITTLKFFPRIVQGDVNLNNNPGNFTEAEIRNVCKISGDVYSLKYHGEQIRT